MTKAIFKKVYGEKWGKEYKRYLALKSAAIKDFVESFDKIYYEEIVVSLQRKD